MLGWFVPNGHPSPIVSRGQTFSGPPPPPSWQLEDQDLVGGRILRTLPLSYDYAQPVRPSGVNHLPGLVFPAKHTLMDAVLKACAKNWEWHLEYDQDRLCTMPQHFKLLLLSYIAVHGPVTGVGLQGLRLLFLKDIHPEATGSDEITHLDLSNTMGRSLSFRDFINFLYDTPGATVSVGSPDTAPRFPSKLSTTDSMPDSWDAIPSLAKRHGTSLARAPTPRFPRLTHLSLSSAYQKRDLSIWLHLLKAVPHLSTLTHLSLAHFPEPTSIGPGVSEVYSSQLSLVNYDYSASDFYIPGDGNWSDAVSILRRLAKGTYCLKYVDFTGCESWWAALRYGPASKGIDWNGSWRTVGTVVLKTVAREVERAHRREDSSEAAVEYDRYKEQERRNKARHTARAVQNCVRAERAGGGGVWCEFILDEDIHDGLRAP